MNKPFRTRKNIAAHKLEADSLASAQTPPKVYPNKRPLRRTLCDPERHRWQIRKFTRRCILCGKEELRP